MLIQLILDQPLLGFTLFFALVIALMWHEVAHGVVAYWLGDPTAQDADRLNFNPMKHLDPLGTLLLLFVGFGWAKPVPVNYYNLKYPKWGPALVAAAGPASHLILIVIAAIVYNVVAPEAYSPLSFADDNLMLLFLSFLIFFNIILMVFNLIPIPPLDGSKVMFAFLPPRLDNVKTWLSTRGPLLLFGLLIVDAVTNIGIFAFLFDGILNLFAGLLG